MFGRRARRRQRLRERAFPPEWRAFVETNVPYYGCLPPDEQRELEGLIQVFLDEKSFEGAGGLEMTDEIRVTIAAQACMLLLGRKTGMYPELQSIIVYPSAYVARAIQRQPDGTVFEGRQVRLGESWSRGALVLSWDDVLRGASDFHDGHNVVLHEFAHQLDDESGVADGAPLLPKPSMYLAWARVLGAEYRSLLESVERHRPTLLDEYAATNPAEFFAVATELFFERPDDFKALYPELYEQLRLFYEQDPAARKACV
jgi:Mlc titration factor MtfA (ptsG expression regulator)